jgi:hypothetical protein
MKKIFIILGVIIIVGIIFFKLKPSPQHTQTVPLHANTTVSSTCNALTITSPKQNEQVSNNFLVKVVVDNSNPKCHWKVSEAQAGKATVKDSSGNIVGSGVLSTSEEWMTDKPVTYSGEIELNDNTSKGNITLSIEEENPSGKPGQTITLPLMY